MNYKKIYDSIIARRIKAPYKGYSERHHIIPKSLGGDNSKSNLVNLSAREHFVVHLLLSKMYPEGSIQWVKMTKALFSMYRICDNHNRYSPSRWYAYSKEHISIANSINQAGSGNSQYGTVWVCNEDAQQNLKIKLSELSTYLNNGWTKGRRMNWNKSRNYISKKRKKKIQENLERKHKNVELYSEYYIIYDKYGWEKFVEITGYDKSKPNLVKQFKKYAIGYVPQNGKRRGTSQFIK